MCYLCGMKPNQASIYREIERLLEWSIPVVERLPRSLPYKELGGLRLKAMQWLKKHLHLQLHKDKFYLQPATHGVKLSLGGSTPPTAPWAT